MATGDNAATRGMDLVAGSAAANTLDTEDNKTRDYIDHYTRWPNIADKPTSFANSDVAASTADGTAAGAPGKLVKFGIAGNIAVATPTAAAHAATKAYVDDQGTPAFTGNTVMRRNADGQTAVATPTSAGHAANKGYVDNIDDTLASLIADVRNGDMDDVVYSRTLSGSYRNLYVKSDGTLGWVASSRTVKKNIKDWTPDRQAILAMQLVQFQYKVAIDTERTGAIEHGLIAEQLDELGLSWLVDYGTTGSPEGVRYDLISLALLSVVQDHEERLTRLEERA